MEKATQKATQNGQNMQLDQPRVLLPEGGQLQKWFIYALVLALGGLGSWGCVITAFEIGVYPSGLIAAGLISCGFAVWRQIDNRKRWWSVSLVAWVVWLLFLVFRFDNIAHGAVRVANTMLDCYGTKLNYDLPVFTLPYNTFYTLPNATYECTAFFEMLQYPFFWAASHMWIKGRNAVEVFALTGVLLMFPMSFSILPVGWAFGTLILFWCVLLFVAPTLSGQDGLRGRWRKVRVSAAYARMGALLVIPAVLACMLLVYWLMPPETYSRPQLVDDLRTGLQEGFASSPYLRSGQGNNNKRVDLNSMGTRSYTGETMLRVKFDWREDPQPEGWESNHDMLIDSFLVDGENDGTIRITDERGHTIQTVQRDSFEYFKMWGANSNKEYLKSFVGTVYTGDSWERLPAEERQELDGLELDVQNMMARYRDEMYLDSRDMLQGYTLSVENVGANPRCVYVPASLASTPEDLAEYQMDFVDDSFLKSGNILLGSREYQLDALGWGYGMNYFSRIFNYIAHREYNWTGYQDMGSANVGNNSVDLYDPQRWMSADHVLLFSGNGNPEEAYPGLISMTEALNTQAEEGGPGWPEDLWKAGISAGPYLTEDELALTAAVEDYNEFVYRHYTQVPEELAGYLNRWREAFDLQPVKREEVGDFRYRDGAQFFASRIAEIFYTYYSYNLSPAMPEQGEDFVEFFLDQSREGFCVHFASAATLLLRSAGYPARYVEGYVVPSNQDGLWVDVPDYNAHAWVEVYCGGTGWIPVEVTPPSVDNPAVYYNATLPPEEDIPVIQPVEDMPTLPPRDEEPDHMRDPDMMGPTMEPRNSPSPEPEQNAGTLAPQKDETFWPVVFSCVGGLAALAGLLWLNRALRIRKRLKDFAQEDRSQAGLKAYACLLKLYGWEAFCGERHEPPERWKELAEKARFSRNMLSPEELRELTSEVERLGAKLREQLPTWQKVRCWLAGLI